VCARTDDVCVRRGSASSVVWSSRVSVTIGRVVCWPAGAVVAMSAKRASFPDSDVDLHLKISNYEETVRHLDIYYGIG